jgi:hypothetical protein
MPLTVVQTYAARTDTAFLQRLAVSLTKQAQNIISESVGTANHPNRDRLARLVLLDPDIWAAKFAIDVALAANIQNKADLASALDVDIDGQVSAVWNSFF